jgi:hypothetical protein
MAWGFITETSELTDNVDKTCWMSIAIIIGLIILVFVMNDLCMKKYNKTKKTVKFEDDESEEDYNKVNKIMNKRQCSLHK